MIKKTIFITASNNTQFHPFPCGTNPLQIKKKKNLNLEGGTPIYSTKFLNQVYLQIIN